MAVAFQSKTDTSWGTMDPVVMTKPSGTTDGDLLIVCIGVLSNAVDSVPSGWTEIHSTSTANNLTFYSYFKVASSEGASWDWGLSASSTAGGSALRFDGAADPSVLSLVAQEGSDANDDSPSFATGVTPTIANSMLVFAFGGEQMGSGTPNIGSYAIATADPTWTERTDHTDGTNVIAVATATRPETTSTGAYSCITGLGNGSADTAAHLIAIAPRTDVTVSLTPIVLTSTMPDVSVTGDANVQLTPLIVSATMPDVTVSTPEPDWINVDKSSEGPTTNVPKS